MASSLTTEQQAAVQMFSEICNVTDEALCIQIMQNHSFDVDHAVNNFLGGGMSAINSSEPANTSYGSSSSSNNNNNNNNSNNNRIGGPTLRRTSSSSSNNGTSDASDGSSTNNTGMAPSRNAFVDSLLRPLAWLLKPRTVYINPDGDCRRFIERYSSKYGSGHPQFCERSFNGAVSQAFRQGKFLLVYLHSPMHQDTEAFCRYTLNKPDLVREWDSNFVCWAGSIHDVEAYSLSIKLQAHSYPYLALLVARSEGEVSVADRIQGAMSEPESLLRRLRGVQMTYQSHISRIQQDQQRRVESVSIREEQDRQFRESELRDRERLELKEKEARKQQEIENARAQKEEEEVRNAAMQAATDASILQHKRDSVQPEPPAAPDVATLRLQLPSGTKLTRRFRKHDTVRDLRNWLDVYFADKESYTLVNYSINTAYPKKELVNSTATLESFGLHPKGMVYIVDLDA